MDTIYIIILLFILAFIAGAYISILRAKNLARHFKVLEGYAKEQAKDKEK